MPGWRGEPPRATPWSTGASPPCPTSQDDPGPAGWIGGYSILQGEDLASVQAILAGHPHNQMGTIEILQMLAMPGA
jgi:hypothetical protein